MSAPTKSDQDRFVTDRSWFIVMSIALIFGIVWTIVGDSLTKVVFVTVAFAFFLNAMINMEMSARKLHAEDGH